MPRTVSIVYRRCGEANAFHDPASATITLCHELTEYVRALVDADADPGSNDPKGDRELREDLVLWAMTFVLYHEIGHALDSQRRLPIAGNVESAVDSIATVIAIETGQPLVAVMGAALFYDQPASLAGVHNGGDDRAGDILCWAAGGDPVVRTAFADPDIVEITGVADVFVDAGRDCADEYLGQQDTVRTWVPGLARLDAVPPGSGPDDPGTGATFRAILGEAWLQGPGSDSGTRVRMERLLADALAPLNDAVAGLPGPIDVVYDTCGQATSFHDAATGTITLCDELVAHAYDTLLRIGDGSETTTELSYLLQLSYDLLAYWLYHEAGHVLHAFGRLSETEDVESAADAVAAVLLVESGEGLTAFNATFPLYYQSAAQEAIHGPVGRRFDDLLCLVFGGDAALRSSLDADRTERYITGERDCIAEYAERREAVRAWLSGTGNRT